MKRKLNLKNEVKKEKRSGGEIRLHIHLDSDRFGLKVEDGCC